MNGTAKNAPGYFDREHKIKTQDQMLAKLRERSSHAVQSGEGQRFLRWNLPEKATQRAEGAPYEVRASRIQEGAEAGKIMYWAWITEPKPKLLGYSQDPQIARSHCEAHHLSLQSPIAHALSAVLRGPA